MSYRRKPFFVKGNFQIALVLGLGGLLFLEVMGAGWWIYRLAAQAIEEAAFRSHLTLQTSAQVIRPVVVRVNLALVGIGILLAGLAVAAAHARLHALFTRMLEGLENLRRNNTSFRLRGMGGKDSRELIQEFNRAASALDKRLGELRLVCDLLLAEKDLKAIQKHHERLTVLISGQ